MAEEKLVLNSYLSFKLGEEIFAANVSKVLNILEMTKITQVPKSPPYMKGVINLRGTVLPVVDTRLKFGMSATEFTPNTCILVMEVEVDGEALQVGGLGARPAGCDEQVPAVLEVGCDQVGIIPAFPEPGKPFRRVGAGEGGSGIVHQRRCHGTFRVLRRCSAGIQCSGACRRRRIPT